MTSSLTIKELHNICKALNIKRYSLYNKDGLIKLINGETPEPPIRKKRKKKQKHIIEKCPICMDKIKKKITTSCNHSFCKTCIKTWCKQNNNCPLCRKNLQNEIIKFRERRRIRRRRLNRSRRINNDDIFYIRQIIQNNQNNNQNNNSNQFFIFRYLSYMTHYIFGSS